MATSIDDYFKATLPGIIKALGSIVKEILKDESFWNDLESACENQYAKHTYANTLLSTNNRLKLEDLYLPPKVKSTNRLKPESYLIDQMPSALLDIHSRVLLTDNAGMGKSTVLRYIFLKAIESNYPKIPMLIDLRKLHDFKSVSDLIRNTLFSNKKTEEFEPLILKLFENGSFLFLLDGFDEIPKDYFEKHIADITKFSESYFKNKFIITSRPETILNSLSSFQGFKFEGLSMQDAQTLIAKYSKCTGLDSDNLIREINLPEHKDVTEFLSNPLMVTLLVVAYTFKKRIPLRRSTFYYQVYDALFEKHDSTKPTPFQRQKHCELDMHQFSQVLNHMAAVSVFAHNYKLEYSKDDLLRLIQKSKESLGLNFSETAFFQDIIQTVPIFVCDGNLYAWTHKSFLDYFCASWLHSSEGHKDHATAKSKMFEKVSVYINILSLYFELKPTEIEKNLFRPFLKNVIDAHILAEKEIFTDYPQVTNLLIKVLTLYDVYIVKKNTVEQHRLPTIHKSLQLKNGARIVSLSTYTGDLTYEMAHISKPDMKPDLLQLAKTCKLDIFSEKAQSRKELDPISMNKIFPTSITMLDANFINSLNDEDMSIRLLNFILSANRNSNIDIKKCMHYLVELEEKLSTVDTSLFN